MTEVINDNFIGTRKLINEGASEQKLQRELKKDLSIFSKICAVPHDEYIIFSELPVGTTGACDFAVFTGRSYMKVYFIEVKGADFSLINNPTKKGATFNASFLEGIDQIIRRKQYSLANELSYRDEAYKIRTIVESGTQMYNSLLSAKGHLLVDKGKPVSVRGVVIGGRSIQGLNQIEAEKRDAWRKSIDFHIELMSWDSFLTSVR
ncbi:hypothetical protein J2W91_004563 [Paenibacillus amylolyticus]|uniref:Shedu protein SduA C-terminal domain-containing protein n=1 Tax=Paenibacillus amylolyticus TaxID=1451 RepID=A0AAP5H556_PAEAM|nr:Shedu immune nuclease family protein [Paenibacillus amylolyticus]MDR6726057.1 hypothetical protein [Paenibacillus amylolyticus]